MTVVLAQATAEGVVQGGWGYVIAAYGAIWLALGLYAANLHFRRRAADAASREEA